MYEFTARLTIPTTHIISPCEESRTRLEHTVAVLGVPRGGTTMVAAAVDALGVNMGPREDMKHFTFEDQRMNRTDVSVQFRAVTQHNEEHDNWGWKDPTGVESVRRIAFAIRNLHVIVVFRDMLASIQGEMRFDADNAISPGRSFEQLATQTIGWWNSLMEFVQHSQVPTLLVSYERALKDPSGFVADTAAFLGDLATHEQRQDAEARIGQRGGYLILPE